jgi:LmbE family N-acetylglucosaminyl deacetylase
LKHLAPCEAWRIREGEARAAQQILGYASATFLHQPDWTVGDDIRGASATLAPLFAQQPPAIIYLPHPREWHPDHQAALPIVLDALRDAVAPAPDLRLYEVWTPLGEHDHVEDISSVIVRKMRAIRCYQSQLRGFRYDRASRGLSQYRGAMAARCAYAEVFQTAGGPQ